MGKEKPTLGKRRDSITSALVLVLVILVLGPLLPGICRTAAAAPNHEAGYSYISVDTIGPKESRAYNISAGPPKYFFQEPPAFIAFYFQVIGNGSLQAYFMRGRAGSSTETITEYSTSENISGLAKVYWLKDDDGEDFTFLLRNEGNSTVEYEIELEVYKEKSKSWAVLLGVTGVGAAVAILVFVVWKYKPFEKKEKSSSPFSFFPVPERPVQLSPTNCPYCKTPLGIQENQLQYTNIRFFSEKGFFGIRKAKNQEKKMMAIFCENCKMILDFTKR